MVYSGHSLKLEKMRCVGEIRKYNSRLLTQSGKLKALILGSSTVC